MFKKLDHIGIAVRDTDEALAFYRDKLGLPVVLSEVIADRGVRVTHLDLGNVKLQLAQPLEPDHPLSAHLDRHGECLHHLCLQVEDLSQAMTDLPAFGFTPLSPSPQPGTRGTEVAFIDPSDTRGVLWELTAGGPRRGR